MKSLSRGLVLAVLTWGVVVASAAEPSGPQNRLSYEDRLGANGHTLVVDGKVYGPYRDVVITAASSSGTAVAFGVVKKDRVFILAQGRESGPIPLGFELDRLQIADDGKVWVLTATRTSLDEQQPNQTLLWVNGKSYGPYPELTTVEYAETGGSWVAAVRTDAEEADVLLSGKAQGPFYTVEHAWLAPNGKSWGYAVSDSTGHLTVVTSEKTWDDVQGANFTALYPREPHWGYALRLEDGGERIVVDGQAYDGYRGFQGLVLTPSGAHWGFQAELSPEAGGGRVVVIDGREYPGDTLSWSRLGAQESFTWTFREGTKVTIQTLKLP